MERKSSEVGADVQEPQVFDKWEAPFGGIKIIKVDEDRGKPGRLAAFGKMVIFATTKRFRWQEDDEVRHVLHAHRPRRAPHLLRPRRLCCP